MLVELNARAFKKLPGSRQSAFEAIDRPALKALPSVPYEYADWKKVRVHLDYHIEFVRHYYSVPHALVGKEWWVGTDWGIGVAGQVLIVRASDDFLGDIGGLGFGVLFSATYN